MDADLERHIEGANARFRWVLIAVIILVIGTTVALARQSQNFGEHNDIIEQNLQSHEAEDRRSCDLAIEFREQFVMSLEVFVTVEGLSPALSAALDGVLADAEQVLADTKAECAKRARH